MSQVLRHWRLMLHLLLGTRRFGVNNGWGVGFNSIFTRPLFGFGFGVIFRPWAWGGMLKVLKLRMEIAGWRGP